MMTALRLLLPNGLAMRRSLVLLIALALSGLVPTSTMAAEPAREEAISGSSVIPEAPSDDLTVAEVPITVQAADAGVTSEGDTAAGPEPQPDAGLVADVAVADGRLATPTVSTTGSDTMGVTWPEDTDGTDLALQVRTKSDGTWSSWRDIEHEEGPDAGTVDAERALRGGTESLWIGDAEAVQVSLDGEAGVAVDDLALVLVGTEPEIGAEEGSDAPDPTPTISPGSTGPSAEQRVGPVVPDDTDVPASPTPSATAAGAGADASGTVVRTAAWSTTVAAGSLLTATSAPAAVRAATSAPQVISRAQWGAPAQVCAPDVAGSLVGAVVHHTANQNSYSTVAEAMAILRADAAYHINSRGWCDIGYNFIVDKWGNTYEGRAGSMTSPVIGVHAGGFNTGTLGVAMLGTYDALPSNATQAAVGTIIGYRLGMYRVDPRSSMSYRTGVGENSRYQNTTVTLPRVFGHRDVSYTACPGNGGYAALPTIRAVAWDTSQAAWSTPPSSLMRTAADATVYLLASGTRHPVKDMATLSAYAALGPVTYVSKQYLAYWPVGPAVSRAAVTTGGTVSFVDAGIRLAFGSCAEVADFGLSCDTAVRLDAAQSSKLHNGGRMQRLYQTTNGKTFYIGGGVRREIADDASRVAAGLPSASVRLTESGLAYLPYGDPIIRSGLLLQERNGVRSISTTTSGNVYLNAGLRAVPGLATGAAAPLDRASIVRVPSAASAAPFVRDSGGRTWFLSDAGRTRVSGPAAPGNAPTLPDAVLGRVPQTADAPSPFLVRPSNGSTVSLVQGGRLAPVRSWSDLVRLAGTDQPTIRVVAGPVLALVATTTAYTPPGTLARSTSSASVYLLDGTAARIPVSTFSVTAELGITRLAVLPEAELAARPDLGAGLRTIVDCGAQRYIGIGGEVWPIRAGDRAAFPSAATPLEPATCEALARADRPAERFLRTSNGTIYWIDGGTKRPISSMTRFTHLGGDTTTLIQVSDFTASRFPTGPNA